MEDGSWAREGGWLVWKVVAVGGLLVGGVRWGRVGWLDVFAGVVSACGLAFFSVAAN